jgi:uridine kinase
MGRGFESLRWLSSKSLWKRLTWSCFFYTQAPNERFGFSEPQSFRRRQPCPYWFILTVAYNGLMDSTSSPIIIGIAGGTGSGKTTIANVLLKRVGAEHIAFLPHDAYYKDLADLPRAQRDLINFDHPDSLETTLLVEHLLHLKQGKSVETPIYDFTRHSRTNETRRVSPQAVILVEGILVFAEVGLRQIFDVKIFVDTPPDIRFIRRLQRDIVERGRTVDSVISQYETTVRPMHLEFVEPSKRHADVIIPEGGLNTVAMDMVVARIESLLGSS